MLEYQYLGHWWVDGRKPYMVYSETNGTSYASENSASAGWTDERWADQGCGILRMINCQVPTPRESVYDHQWGMMYDDAHADWGHRDNILGTTHRQVSIGIASNGRLTTFVQHFQRGDAIASGPPELSTSGRVSFSISKVAPGISVGALITVYYDPLPSSKTPAQINQLHSYCTGGGFTTVCADPIARILRPPDPGFSYASLGPTEVVATTWTESSSVFSFTADLGELGTGPGVYTFVVWRDSGGRVLKEQLVALSAYPK